MSRRLPLTYYRQTDVVALARDLLGKVLFTRVDGQTTGVIITETEAYNGIVDRASHAFGGRRTTRTEVMYSRGGVSYVYLCYGIHYLFNIVTGEKDVPHAILIRGGIPIEGQRIMTERRRLPESRSNAPLSGPGILSKAMGIDKALNALPLNGPALWLEDHSIVLPETSVVSAPRIGVDYAGEDALLPYRFVASL